MEKKKEIKDTEQTALEKKIKEFKSKYKKVYSTNIADEVFIWRTLKRSEYKEIMALGEDDEKLSSKDLIYLREEYLTKKVLLYPENVEDIIEDIAGVAEVISAECMDKSGFNTGTVTVKL